MKPSLAVGLSTRREVTVDESRCIGFMGKEGMVYATPRMVSDVEYTCRDFLLQHLDAGEDSVGAHVSIDHLAATPATPWSMRVTLLTQPWQSMPSTFNSTVSTAPIVPLSNGA